MNVDRLSVTMDAELGAAVRDAAARAGMSVSAWLARAASEQLRNDLLGEALDRWEAEQGSFDQSELDAAALTLALERNRRAKAS